MIEASRRSFITGLVALVAAPAIVRARSLMPVNSGLIPDLWFDQESARVGTERLQQYVPLVPETRLDVLYSYKRIRPEWEWLTIEADGTGSLPAGTQERIPRLPDPAVVMEDARRMYSFNSEADRKRFYANWEGDYAFMSGEQWDVTQRVANAVFAEKHDPFGLSPIPDGLALAAAAVAIAPVVLAKPMTRRFWGK